MTTRNTCPGCLKEHGNPGDPSLVADGSGQLWHPECAAQALDVVSALAKMVHTTYAAMRLIDSGQVYAAQQALVHGSKELSKAAPKAFPSPTLVSSNEEIPAEVGG